MRFRKGHIYRVEVVDHWGHLGNQESERGTPGFETVGVFSGFRTIKGKRMVVLAHTWSDDPDVSSYTVLIEAAVIKTKELR